MKTILNKKEFMRIVEFQYYAKMNRVLPSFDNYLNWVKRGKS